ncbi:magnesium chelatase, partial [Brevibacillus thermoruber]
VVGFGADGEAQRQLKEVAEAAGGRYVLIQDQKELEKEFQQAEEIARKWRKWKDGASYEALSANLSQAVDISVYGSTWYRLTVRESYNFLSAFMDMRRLKILNEQTIEELEKIDEQHEKLAIQRGDEMEAFLDELNDKTYRETIDAINKQYSKNVKVK